MSGNTTIPGPGGGTISFSVSGAVTQAIASAFAADLANLANAGELEVKEVKVKGGKVHVPTPQPGKTLELIVTGGTAGQTATLDLTAKDGNAFIINESQANLIIDASKDPNAFSIGSGAVTYFGGSGNGIVGADSTSGNQYFQALGSGGGNYAIAYSSGNNTIWASSGNDLIAPGSGNNLVGLGSGDDTVVSTGTDTIVASTGNATVIGGVADLVFANQGSLVFVAQNSNSTVVGSTGAETVFGGPGNGLYFVGTGSFLMASNGGSDTIVGGAGASSVAAIDHNGGAITLFSSTDNNQLIAGGGNETLNALGTSGTNVFWAGGGADSLIGGTGANVFAFVAGGSSVGGNDTIANWTAKDTLALIGYSASDSSQAVVGGSAVITLSDGTKITIAGVAHHISSIVHS